MVSLDNVSLSSLLFYEGPILAPFAESPDLEWSGKS